MATMSNTPQVNVIRCSQCRRDTEYHCRTCRENLCPSCKSNHTLSIDTKHHYVSLYREMFTSFYKNEKCATHPGQVYEMYCETCDIPVCLHCRKHTHHKLLGIRAVYDDIREQNEKIITNIRSETLFYANTLKNGFKTIVNNDVTAFRTKIFPNQLNAIKEKSQRLKYSMDSVVGERSYFGHSHRCLKQMIQLKRHIARIQKYEEIYEKSAHRPVQLLQFIKKNHFPQIQDTSNLKKHCPISLTPEINMEDLTNFLSDIQITASGKQRRAENKLLLTLLSSPVLQKSLAVKGVQKCCHMSFATQEQVWLSDRHNLILTDTATGDTLYDLENFSKIDWGLHTVNNACELIFIDKDCNINKLNSVGKPTTILKKSVNSSSKPQCLYCSSFNGDLLVGMYKHDTRTVKLMRYNETGCLIQTIPSDDPPKTLYRSPIYITENNNGDIVVSDDKLCAVVVTSNEGKHRFSYKGPESGSVRFLPGIRPRGICTDALSHILVCDEITDTVQMIDQDGRFISYLLTNQSKGLLKPRALSYDINTHRLWVGTFEGDNNLSVHRCIDRLIVDCEDVYGDDSEISDESRNLKIPGTSQEEYDILTERQNAKKAVERAGKAVEYVKKAAVIAVAEFSKEEDKAKEKKRYEIMIENMEEAKKNAEAAEKEAIMATTLKAVKAASKKAVTEAGKVIVKYELFKAEEKAKQAAKRARKEIEKIAGEAKTTYKPQLTAKLKAAAEKADAAAEAAAQAAVMAKTIDEAKTLAAEAESEVYFLVLKCKDH